jgi:hypothetical protein
MASNAEIAQNLRDLADFLEQHEEVPPVYSMTLNAFTHTKEELQDVARKGAPWEKIYEAGYFSLRKRFGPVTLDINLNREKVCRRVVTGTRIVPAQPAEPEHEEDIVEWVCEDPILEGEKPDATV